MLADQASQVQHILAVHHPDRDLLGAVVCGVCGVVPDFEAHVQELIFEIIAPQSADCPTSAPQPPSSADDDVLTPPAVFVVAESLPDEDGWDEPVINEDHGFFSDRGAAEKVCDRLYAAERQWRKDLHADLQERRRSNPHRLIGPPLDYEPDNHLSPFAAKRFAVVELSRVAG